MSLEQLNALVDNKFVALMLEIEKRYQAPHCAFQKYEKIRIEQWVIIMAYSFQCKKLCMVTQNLQWKKNRNLYGMLLLDQIINKKLGKPFIKMPPDESLPVLSPAEVVISLAYLRLLRKPSSQTNSKNSSSAWKQTMPPTGSLARTCLQPLSITPTRS